MLLACTGAAPPPPGDGGNTTTSGTSTSTSGGVTSGGSTTTCEGAAEVCNDVDDDCDGLVDADDPDLADGVEYHPDMDGDGYGTSGVTVIDCEAPESHVEDGSDCDDRNAAAYPGGDDTWYDGVDGDCDGESDYDADGDGWDSDEHGGDDCDDTDADVGPSIWNWDGDGDGYGDAPNVVYDCTQPDGYVGNGSDCDDDDARVHPDALTGCTDEKEDLDCDGTPDAYIGDIFFAADDGKVTDLTETAGTEWVVSEGGALYLCPGSWPLTLTVAADASVLGVGGASSTELEGGGSGPVIAVDGPYSVTISGLTLTGGVADQGGGLRLTAGAIAAVSDVEITGNSAAVAGGGIYLSDAVLEMTDCEITGNTAPEGGGLAIVESDVSLDGGGVHTNAATDGGGAWMSGTSTLASVEGLWGETKTENSPEDVDSDTDGWSGPYFEFGDPASFTCDAAGCADMTWYADADGDGYGDETAARVAGGAQPSGYVSGAGDCDDTDADVYPGAAETWYDDVDQDCAGDDDHDADGDGHQLDKSGGDDCDDSEPLVHVGRFELCDNGADDDCNGKVDDCAWSGLRELSTADLTLLGDEPSDRVGVTANVGDLNGDGRDELMIGASSTAESDAGSVYLFWGNLISLLGTSGSASDADMTFLGESTGDAAGAALSGAGDIHDDGFDDLLIGAAGDDTSASGAGAVYLLYGGMSAGGSLAGADLKLLGEALYDAAGGSIASAGDIDGDGLSDVLIGATGAGRSDEGAAYLFTGASLGVLGGEVSLSRADLTLTGENRADSAGGAVASAGDVDGDGLSDVLVSATGEDTAGGAAGAVYLLLADGALSGTRADLSDADLKLLGEQTSDYAGSALASGRDEDGDGLSDLLIGAYRENTAAADAGALYLLRSDGALDGLEGAQSLSLADLKITGEAEDDQIGAVVDWMDLNDDGVLEIATIAAATDARPTGWGYIIGGDHLYGLQGTLGVGSADVQIPAMDEDSVMSFVSSVGDIDETASKTWCSPMKAQTLVARTRA